MFMENYAKAKVVQCCGLDSLIHFARNADCLSQIGETRTIEIVSNTIKEFKSNKDVIWRACIVLSTIALLDEDIGFEITQYDIHNVVVDSFSLPEFKEEFRAQQQILWLLDAILKSFKGKRRVHTSEKCMELFISLSELREQLIREKAFSATERFKPFELVLPFRIREFLRETKGQVSVEAPPEPPKRKIKKRRNFDGNI